jgi:hypothetical protein
MAEERMSDREIRDRFDSIDKRLDRMVPLDTWTLQIGYDREKHIELDQACRERTDDVEKTAMAATKSVADAATKAVDDLKKTKQTTWSWAAQVIGWGIALVAAVIAAKGIK